MIMMNLRLSAEDAEDAAAGIRIFRAPVPERSAEITGLVAELFAISSLLKDLEDLANDRSFRANLILVRTDLDIVQASLKYTLDDLIGFFADVEENTTTTTITNWTISRRDTYRRIWFQLSRFFLVEASFPLNDRLGKYRSFLQALVNGMGEYVKPFTPLFFH